MAQHDYNLANQQGAAFRTDLNNALGAIGSSNSGPLAPTTTFPGMMWFDTTANLIKVRDEANTSWITVAALAGTSWTPYRQGAALGTASVKDTGTSGDAVPVMNQAATFSDNLTGARLRATATAGVTLASTGHGFQVGATGGANLAADTGEVQARNNGAAATLHLNRLGGPVEAGDSPVVTQASFEDDLKAMVPAGSLIMSAKAAGSDPAGWLFCDGRDVSRTTYADLFTAIGTLYGTGDGSTTFGIPDCRGKSPLGVNDAGLPGGADGAYTTRNEANVGGEEDHVLTVSELAAHTHQYARLYSSSGGAFVQNSGDQRDDALNTSQSTGGDAGHNTMHPFLTINFLIKT